MVSSDADSWFHRWCSGRLAVTQIAGSEVGQGCAGWQRLGWVRERREDGLRHW